MSSSEHCKVRHSILPNFTGPKLGSQYLTIVLHAKYSVQTSVVGVNSLGLTLHVSVKINIFM